jgi:tetratricopeptide (TPR) repeat protein
MVALAGCAHRGTPPSAQSSPSAQSAESAQADTPRAVLAEYQSMSRKYHSPRRVARLMLKQAKAGQESGKTTVSALLALRAGDFDTAADAAAYLRKLKPDRPDAWAVSLRVDLARADLAQARKAAEKAYTLGGAKAVSMGLGGAVDPWFVYSIATELARAHPDDPALQLLLARGALSADAPNEALKAARTAADFGPGERAAKFIGIQALWSLGRHDEALTQAARTLSGHGHDIGLRIFYANMLARVGDRRQAYEVLGDARALSDENSRVDFGYALVAAALGDTSGARKQLASLLGEGGENEGVYNLLGTLAAGEGEWGEAFGWYQQIHSTDKLASSRVASLIALDHWKDSDAALDYLEQLQDNFPGLAPTWAGARANILAREGKDGTAWEQLGKVLERYPDVQPLSYQRAMLADKLGKTDAALAALKRLVKAAPDNPLFLNGYGYTLTEHTSRYREAYGYIKRALAIMPNNGAVLDSLGWVLYKMQQPAKALDYLRRAWKQSNDIDVARHLVEVYVALDRRGEARKILSTALHKSPKNPQLLQLKRRLAKG